MKQSGRRRGFKSWFVEPYRQVKLGLIFLLLNFLFAGLTFTIFGYYIWDIYQTLAVYFKLTSDQSVEIMQKFQTPIFAGLILLFAFVVASILLSVRYTFKIYGPLVSIHRFLDEFLQGETVHPLILRESDQLQDLANKLNLLVTRIPSPSQPLALTTLNTFLDDLLAGRQPTPLPLNDDDPLRPLMVRLNALANSKRS